MPELIEQMYCSQQIVIPPKFPYILKRYCKAAIKTQPYDLLRWSFEYFKALAANKPPPVKLRLEYPIYSTEGGLTRGCLKVLAHQLSSTAYLPLPAVKSAWQGFCLDPVELRRILCLCEVYLKEDSVPFLHFIAVAGGLLTKCLTHTMILLCESLTKEPDGGSAAIPKDDFLTMYRFLAEMDAARDVKYFNGCREGAPPEIKVEEEEDTETVPSTRENLHETLHALTFEDDYWVDQDLQRVSLIDDHVPKTPRLSIKLTRPTIADFDRSPSIEKLKEIERENYMRERTERLAVPSEDVEKKLRELSLMKMASSNMNLEKKDSAIANVEKVSVTDVTKEDARPEIMIFDEENQPLPLDIYEVDADRENSTMQSTQNGNYEESKLEEQSKSEAVQDDTDSKELQTSKTSRKSAMLVNEEEDEDTVGEYEGTAVSKYLDNIQKERKERIADLENTFDEIAVIVDAYNTANYDLGMVAGRQMSTTSGEFIAKHIEKHVMAFVDEQIAVLPDPDTKKKKAKPEEVLMIKELLEDYLDENMDVIAPDLEEVEEEESPVPEITVVYAVPGIGSPVDEDTIKTFEEYIHEICQVQADMVMPRNLRHFLCPPLEKFIEHIYESDDIKDIPKKEEVPVSGTITE